MATGTVGLQRVLAPLRIASVARSCSRTQWPSGSPVRLHVHGPPDGFARSTSRDATIPDAPIAAGYALGPLAAGAPCRRAVARSLDVWTQVATGRNEDAFAACAASARSGTSRLFEGATEVRHVAALSRHRSRASGPRRPLVSVTRTTVSMDLATTITYVSALLLHAIWLGISVYMVTGPCHDELSAQTILEWLQKIAPYDEPHELTAAGQPR